MKSYKEDRRDRFLRWYLNHTIAALERQDKRQVKRLYHWASGLLARSYRHHEMVLAVYQEALREME